MTEVFCENKKGLDMNCRLTFIPILKSFQINDKCEFIHLVWGCCGCRCVVLKSAWSRLHDLFLCNIYITSIVKPSIN